MHTLYLDDSGTKEYSPTGVYAANNSRHFVFGGHLLTTDSASQLTREIIALKRGTFGSPTVEIKSNWLRIPTEREKRYLTPFSVTDEQLRAFVDAYYEAVCRADLVLLAAVVDKVHMKADYNNPWYPPAAAYEAVLQRAEMAVRERGSSFTVIIDDMTGKTPAQNSYKENLTRQHSQLRKRGSRLLENFAFSALTGDLTFASSAVSHMVQVADIVSYNVMRQFRDHGEEWEQHLENLPTYDWFRRVCPKFRQGPGGRVQGFGIVKLPLRRRVEWRVVDRGAAP